MDDFGLETHNVLKEDDIKGLEVISDEDFADIVKLMFLNAYKSIPEVVRLPNLNKELSDKLGLAKDTSFIMKKRVAHIRPGRKGLYGQVLSFDEYCAIPKIIRETNFVVVDKTHHNFQVVFDDAEGNLKKINKLIFNKDVSGNYLVTLGKVDRVDAFSEVLNTVVRVGCAPTIQALRFPTELPVTRFRASLTTDNVSISDSEEKSSVQYSPKDKAEYYSKKASEETDVIIRARYEEKADYWQKIVAGKSVSPEAEVRCGPGHKWTSVDHIVYWRHCAEVASSPDEVAECLKKAEEWMDAAIQEQKAEKMVEALIKKDKIDPSDWTD